MAPQFPEEFEQKIRSVLADEWDAFEAAHSSPAPVSIRLNPARQTDVSYPENVPWTKHGKYLPERPVFTLDPTFHGGAYYVQEASSMFLEQAFSQHIDDRPLRVLDLCAAPGGKSTHLLSLINSDSILVSNEVIRTRVSVLTENIIKWGYPNVVVTNNDSADFSELTGLFDVIVVDAPCSGEGLFRKDPEAMDEWSEQNVDLCSARQRRILHEIWPALKDNGILIYSTCTYEPKENESNLQAFSREYEVEFLSIQLESGWNIQTVDEGNIIGYRCFPHRVKGEGFFISAMRKKGGNEISTKSRKETFTPAPAKTLTELSRWFVPAPLKFIQRNETIQLLPAAHYEFISFLSQHLRINYAGTFIAQQKHNKFIPEHAAALSILLNRSQFPVIDFNIDQALQYLRKENITISIPDRKSFSLGSYRNIPLGWMNVIPGRINNLYPSEWRIKMR
jgi:16S rRNA C967 or C1407 C5-methylase (RsmB/RsmF family)/NOL1/NOP2/fmu family ribosome biogenesis protein